MSSIVYALTRLFTTHKARRDPIRLTRKFGSCRLCTFSSDLDRHLMRCLTETILTRFETVTILVVNYCHCVFLCMG